MDALVSFLRSHRPLLEAHVVNFFEVRIAQDRLWEIVDAEWMECLRREPVESLLKLPSGCVRLIPDLHVASIGTVLAQGMNSEEARSSVEKQQLKLPRTVTCHVLSSDTLAAVMLDACKDDHGEHAIETRTCTEESPQIQEPTHRIPPLILAGLHACGDLSVNMLRVFVSCKQVKALVLEKYFPEVSRLSPSIGRQGKALRRQRLQKVMESHMAMEKTDDFSCTTLKEQNMNTYDVYGVDTGSDDIHHDECQKFALFKDFTISGLDCLGCGSVEDVSLLEIWKDVHPFTEYIGPFWCLRAALGPPVETYFA